MDEKAIQTRVAPETKQAFLAAAKAHGTSESQFLRLIIERLLKVEQAPPKPFSSERTEKRVRIAIGLTESEAVEVNSRAASMGIARTEWIVKLILSHLSSHPQFSPADVDALLESNRQLAAIGRNLNQIAKTLNLDPNASYQVTVESIGALAADIKAHRKVVSSLLDANLDRWGVGDGK